MGLFTFPACLKVHWRGPAHHPSRAGGRVIRHGPCDGSRSPGWFSRSSAVLRPRHPRQPLPSHARACAWVKTCGPPAAYPSCALGTRAALTAWKWRFPGTWQIRPVRTLGRYAPGSAFLRGVRTPSKVRILGVRTPKIRTFGTRLGADPSGMQAPCSGAPNA